jgi:hypothetical protein
MDRDKKIDWYAVWMIIKSCTLIMLIILWSSTNIISLKNLKDIILFLFIFEFFWTYVKYLVKGE